MKCADAVVDIVFLGPISEFIGRSRVLYYSFAVFFLLNFPVAFGKFPYTLPFYYPVISFFRLEATGLSTLRNLRNHG